MYACTHANLPDTDVIHFLGDVILTYDMPSNMTHAWMIFRKRKTSLIRRTAISLTLNADKNNTLIVPARAGAHVRIWHKIFTSVSLPKARSQVKYSYQLGYLGNFLFLGIICFLAIVRWGFIEAMCGWAFYALIIAMVIWITRVITWFFGKIGNITYGIVTERLFRPVTSLWRKVCRSFQDDIRE